MKNIQKRPTLLALPVLTVLLTVTVAGALPEVFAHIDCSPSGEHCYSTVIKTHDNRGGSTTANINGGNSIVSGYAITNPLWINFPNDSSGNSEWMEVGWQKGSPMLPCNSASTAKFYWYEGIGTNDGACLNAVSGSTATYKITDADKNSWWSLYINGQFVKQLYYNGDALRMSVGGESTHEDNVLDGGGDKSLTIIYPSGTTYSWGGSNLSNGVKTAHYTYGWNTQYTDFHYEGP